MIELPNFFIQIAAAEKMPLRCGKCGCFMAKTGPMGKCTHCGTEWYK